MGSDLVALFLNSVIAILLVATILYVYRLTKSLDEFKKHRRELDSVIANLLSSIDKADSSVQNLKHTTAQESSELERLIGQAKALSDELTIINEASENIAKRLEKLAETNRKIVQPANSISNYVSNNKEEKISSPVHRRVAKRRSPEKKAPIGGRKDSYSSTLKRVDVGSDAPKDDFPSFMIHDRDIENISDIGENLDSESYSSESDLQSQAEKDLLEALRSSKRNIVEDNR